MFINNIFHSNVKFWNSRLVIIGISDFQESITFTYLYILNFYPLIQNLFLQLVYFIKFRLRLWIDVNTSGLWPFWKLLLICSGFTWVWVEEIFCDSASPFVCVAWRWLEWKLLLLALYLVIHFHISIVSSISNNWSPSQKGICFVIIIIIIIIIIVVIVVVFILQLANKFVTSASASSLSTVQVMYLYITACVMPWVSFKLYF